MASRGTCKSFDGLKGWGFIDMEGTVVFVHIKDCTGLQPKQGDELSFDLEAKAQDPSKFKAKNVSGGTAPREQQGGGNMQGTGASSSGTGALQGTVKSFNGAKGFGFIALSGGGDDVFLLAKDCVGSMPQQGDLVKFDVAPSPSKPGQMQAKNVTGGSQPMGQSGMGGMMGQGMMGGKGMMGGMGGYGAMMGGMGGMGKGGMMGNNPYSTGGLSGGKGW
ncbi:unnamed protein product [Polarella glacialis]|uniref:CSD domain-containing protein n=1 Tax=Polarella glacialis TaxID=89957 RepID=A0A813EXT8_POLGL|nr:unnamed protein product [Polarella glacialis]CAE8680838.1 unnamed protein product [Polarella glacialis]